MNPRSSQKALPSSAETPDRTPPEAKMWLIVFGLSLGPAVSNGLARFAYGLVLPAMKADLSWSYSEAGWLNTANAAGYLLGAVFTFALINRIGARPIFAGGIIVTPFALAGSAFTADLWLQSVLRILAGIAGAGIFISGGALAAMMFRASSGRNALAISLYFGGVGLGMIASGAVPLLLNHWTAAAWPVAWLFLAGLSALAAGPALLAAARSLPPHGDTEAGKRSLPLASMLFATLGYFLFAIGYIVYLTFLVVLISDSGANAQLVAACWTLLGLGSILAPFLWRSVLARSMGGGALALACLLTGAATLLPLALPNSLSALVLSVILFGFSFLIAPTAVASFARKNLDPSQVGRAIGMFTCVFAIGQIVGPVFAGFVADLSGSVSQGMALAGFVLLAGAVAAALQSPLTPSPISKMH